MKSESEMYDNWCGQFVERPRPFDPDADPECEDLLKECLGDELAIAAEDGEITELCLELAMGTPRLNAKADHRNECYAFMRIISKKAYRIAKQHWEKKHGTVV